MRRPMALRLYLALAASNNAPDTPWAPPELDHARSGPMVWVHCETLENLDAAISFSHHLRAQRDDIEVLLSTQDPILYHNLEGLFHCVIPNENTEDCAAFLEFWSPEMLAWIGSGLRPVLLDATTGRGIPMILANGTETMELSKTARTSRGVRRDLLRKFDQIFATDEAAMMSLGKLVNYSERLSKAGLLQSAPPVLDCDEDVLLIYKDVLKERPLWLAAASHPDDQATVVLAHRQALRANHRLLLVLQPADAKEGQSIAEDLNSTGWHTAQLSKGQMPMDDTQILIADIPNQLGLWYRLAPVSFVGGTMAGQAATNPYHPASLGSAILNGPNTAPYRTTFDLLSQNGAARKIRTPEQLLTALNDVLQPHIMASMAHAAWQVTSTGAEATDMLIAAVEAKFDALGY